MPKSPEFQVYRDKLSDKLQEIRQSDPENPEKARAKAQRYLESKQETKKYQKAREEHLEDIEKKKDEVSYIRQTAFKKAFDRMVNEGKINPTKGEYEEAKRFVQETKKRLLDEFIHRVKNKNDYIFRDFEDLKPEEQKILKSSAEFQNAVIEHSEWLIKHNVSFGLDDKIKYALEILRYFLPEAKQTKEAVNEVLMKKIDLISSPDTFQNKFAIIIHILYVYREYIDREEVKKAIIANSEIIKRKREEMRRSPSGDFYKEHLNSIDSIAKYFGIKLQY